MKTKSDGVVKQEEAAVLDFIEEHRPILEDPEAGYSALSRIYIHSAEMITPLGKKSEAAASRATRATNDLTAAMNDPNCSAATINKREKEKEWLLSEHQRLHAAFFELANFSFKVKKRLDSEFDENGVPTEKASEPPPSEPNQQSSSWWQRLFGRKAEAERRT